MCARTLTRLGAHLVPGAGLVVSADTASQFAQRLWLALPADRLGGPGRAASQLGPSRKNAAGLDGSQHRLPELRPLLEVRQAQGSCRRHHLAGASERWTCPLAVYSTSWARDTAYVLLSLAGARSPAARTSATGEGAGRQRQCEPPAAATLRTRAYYRAQVPEPCAR
eukprot:scaffold3210_cov402-Prasinococcus_capsulatus_cf.AAC.4